MILDNGVKLQSKVNGSVFQVVAYNPMNMAYSLKEIIDSNGSPVEYGGTDIVHHTLINGFFNMGESNIIF